jgi:DtxR family Mn-dependent transcriptional regulator
MAIAVVDLGNLSPSIQDYLKAIYTLGHGGEMVSTVQLATALGVAPASVTNMLQKLAADELRLVNYQKHQGVRLTVAGQQAALRIIRRHRLLETFLSQMLGYSWDVVHAEAEQLEHVISPRFEDRISALLGEPTHDPHGDPIPDRQLQIDESAELIPLARLQTGATGVIRQVDSQDEHLLIYFESVGVQPGRKVTVVQRNPLDGTLRVVIEGTQGEPIFGGQIADAVFVTA